MQVKWRARCFLGFNPSHTETVGSVSSPYPARLIRELDQRRRRRQQERRRRVHVSELNSQFFWLAKFPVLYLTKLVLRKHSLLRLNGLVLSRVFKMRHPVTWKYLIHHLIYAPWNMLGLCYKNSSVCQSWFFLGHFFLGNRLKIPTMDDPLQSDPRTALTNRDSTHNENILREECKRASSNEAEGKAQLCAKLRYD